MNNETKPWGNEIIWANSDKYSGKILIIKEGEETLFGYNKSRDKTIFILQGVITLVLEGRSKMLGEKETYHIQPKIIHQIKAIKGDATILEVGTTITDDFVEVKV
jgi:mannose-6-phosphate isomerase-like protein (cupin superfamily)